MLQGVSRKPDLAEFVTLCNETGGNISAIARTIQPPVTRKTVHDWVADDADFKQAIDDARESALDLAEDRAMMLIQGIPIRGESGEIVAWQERPDAGLIKFVLATRGKKRGYAESVEVSGKDGDPLVINFIKRG